MEKVKKVIVTGISGQDGFFIARLLLEKKYEVHGIVRRNSQMTIGTMQSLEEAELKQIHIHWGDITDNIFIDTIIQKVKPDELYHLAAQSFVAYSFENPTSTFSTNINGTLNIILAIKAYSPKTKMYFAGTSELFGLVQETPQTEKTAFYPRSPYGISKLAGFWSMKNYRESYNLFLANGILFNHESEMRGKEFVTRKITYNVAKYKNTKSNLLELGNIDAKRDWGYSKDYVYGMWLILQKETPDDYVLATGETHTVREFVIEAYRHIGVELEWSGSGPNEQAIDKQTGKVIVKIDPKFYRPSEVELLLGNPAKAKKELKWEPVVKFKELVKIMVDYDLKHYIL